MFNHKPIWAKTWNLFKSVKFVFFNLICIHLTNSNNTIFIINWLVLHVQNGGDLFKVARNLFVYVCVYVFSSCNMKSKIRNDWQFFNTPLFRVFCIGFVNHQNYQYPNTFFLQIRCTSILGPGARNAFVIKNNFVAKCRPRNVHQICKKCLWLYLSISMCI